MAIVGEYVQSGESSMPCVKAHVSIPSFKANGDIVFLVDTGASTTVLLPESICWAAMSSMDTSAP